MRYLERSLVGQLEHAVAASGTVKPAQLSELELREPFKRVDLTGGANPSWADPNSGAIANSTISLSEGH